jgi:hypothetical protein
VNGAWGAVSLGRKGSRSRHRAPQVQEERTRVRKAVLPPPLGPMSRKEGSAAGVAVR